MYVRDPSVNVERQVNRKGHTLTYSCPKDADDNPIASCEELLEFVVKLGGTINKYIIAEELLQS